MASVAILLLISGGTAIAATGTSPNATGYIVNSDEYDYSSLQWTVPRVTADSQYRYSSIWPSIGNGSDLYNDELCQIGTEQDSTPSGTNYYAWWEVYPLIKTAQPLGLGVHPGDQMFATVRYYEGSTSSECDMQVWNNTTGGYSKLIAYQMSYAFAGPFANAIVERPSVNGGLPYLAKFGQVIGQPYFEVGSNGGCVAHWPATRLDMYDGSTLLAYSRYDTSDGCMFTTTRTGNE